MKPSTSFIEIQNYTLYCRGDWNLPNIKDIDRSIQKLEFPARDLTIDAADIGYMDTAGAWRLQNLINKLTSSHHDITLQGMTTAQQCLLDIVAKNLSNKTPSVEKPSMTTLALIGKSSIQLYWQIQKWLGFIGELFLVGVAIVTHPKRQQWRAVFTNIERSGYRALPIIGFLSFLIGVVLTYEMGLQLRYYGANIFIVNFLGIAILREFAPLMTAIIIAGRSGSAFTAQLGTMQVNEEIDALKTMGIHPADRLIWPKIIGLMLAMPLLTVWSDIFGILGGMIMAKNILAIGYVDFLHQFPRVVTTTSFMIGMIKAPVFAVIISMVGCFQGLQVRGGADSVGWHTTKSVVQALFLIILMDAVFAIWLSWYDI
ncbi:MlaE family lipid ABC transporter permease subunit [soil metagenome]